MIAEELMDNAEMATETLTELELQDRVLSELGDKFKFPLFNGRHVIESQRKSGYKNSARAAREIVDNAYEAGAKNLWITFRRPTDAERGKHERRDSIASIAFIDDGPGMRPNMARYALSWGGGTRFDKPKGIGRFGFGLPNSSINQTQRVEVFTRTAGQEPWSRTVLDITPEKLAKILPSGLVSVDPPEVAKLPANVKDYLKRNKISLESGTVVVWDKPDRLSARSAANLKELLLDDFGVVYRYLLKDFSIVVDGTSVEPVDPLFLTPAARFHLPCEEGGAECIFEKQLPVKYYRDLDTGSQHLKWLDSVEAVREARSARDGAAIGVISVRIARFPYGFLAKRVQPYATMEKDARHRFQVRLKRRGFSYVRANREIDFVLDLPLSDTDKAAGLGDWPTLQSYARSWAVEIRFSPDLDEAFGIGNDKQTVNPIEDFWRVLRQAEVDRAVRAEEKHQREIRERAKEEAAAQEVSDKERVNPASEAAAAAETAMGRGRPLPKERATESQQRFEEAVTQKAKETGRPRDEVEEAARNEAKRHKYGIDFFTAEGGVFYKPDWGNGLQRLALINKAHPFFRGFYAELTRLPTPRPRQAVDLLLLALAKAELEADENLKRQYEHQREAEWSPFLKLGLDILNDMVPAQPDTGDEEEVE